MQTSTRHNANRKTTIFKRLRSMTTEQIHRWAKDGGALGLNPSQRALVGALMVTLTARPLQPPPGSTARAGIYFIQAGVGGLVKIGSSNNVERRCLELQTGNPETLVILAVCDGNELDEKTLHRRLRARHRRGEWFAIDPSEIPSIVESVWPGRGLQ